MTNSFISSHQFISLFQSQQTDIFLWNTTTCLVTVYDNTTTYVLTKLIKIRLSECFERINYIQLSSIKDIYSLSHLYLKYLIFSSYVGARTLKCVGFNWTNWHILSNGSEPDSCRVTRTIGFFYLDTIWVSNPWRRKRKLGPTQGKNNTNISWKICPYSKWCTSCTHYLLLRLLQYMNGIMTSRGFSRFSLFCGRWQSCIICSRSWTWINCVAFFCHLK